MAPRGRRPSRAEVLFRQISTGTLVTIYALAAVGALYRRDWIPATLFLGCAGMTMLILAPFVKNPKLRR